MQLTALCVLTRVPPGGPGAAKLVPDKLPAPAAPPPSRGRGANLEVHGQHAELSKLTSRFSFVNSFYNFKATLSLVPRRAFFPLKSVGKRLQVNKACHWGQRRKAGVEGVTCGVCPLGAGWPGAKRQRPWASAASPVRCGCCGAPRVWRGEHEGDTGRAGV